MKSTSQYSRFFLYEHRQSLPTAFQQACTTACCPSVRRFSRAHSYGIVLDAIPSAQTSMEKFCSAPSRCCCFLFFSSLYLVTISSSSCCSCRLVMPPPVQRPVQGSTAHDPLPLEGPVPEPLVLVALLGLVVPVALWLCQLSGRTNVKMYRVRQQKPDAQNFSSKETFF